MPGYQILVKFLDGKTRCLQFPCSSVTDGDLKSRIHALAGIPVEEQRLVTGTREVGVAETLEAGPDGVFPSCTMLLRLRGGKGGFGSLLRGAATKAGQKKTSNFDACRDMSGRRLRHVNAEKKLKEWKAEAQERELEKTAEEYLKKLQKVKKEDSGIMEEMKVIREKSERARESVELAVKSGLAEAKKQMEQKAEAVKVGTKRKLPYLSFPTDDSEDSDEDEDDESGDEENLSTPPKPLPSLHEDDESGDEENLSTPPNPLPSLSIVPMPLPRLTETSSCQL